MPDTAVLDTPATSDSQPSSGSPAPSLVQELKVARGGSLSDTSVDHSQNSSLSKPDTAPPASPITPKPATPSEAPTADKTPARGPDGKFVSADGGKKSDDPSTDPPPSAATIPALALTDLTDDELTAFAEAEGLTLDSPEDRAFVGRLFLRELSRLATTPSSANNEANGAMTEFERNLAAKLTAAPSATLVGVPPASPNPPVTSPNPAGGAPSQVVSPQPAAAPGPALSQPAIQQTYKQLSEQINDGFLWASPIDAVQATMDEFARIGNEADMHAQANRPYKPDLTRLHQIEEAKQMRAFAQQLPAIGTVVQQIVAEQIKRALGTEFDARFQPILPAVQHFQQQQMAGSVNAAIDDLASSEEYASIRDYFIPTPGATSTLKYTDPATGQTAEFIDNPINRVFVQHPEIFDIEVAADPAKGISELDALRLTATKRYRMAANFLNAGRVSSDSARKLVAQGLKAGKAQSTRQILEQARQRMNSTTNGSPAAAKGGGGNSNGNGNGNDSVVKQMVDSGGMTTGKSFGSLFK